MPQVSFKEPNHKQNDRSIFGFRSRVAEDPVLLRHDADPQVSMRCHIADEWNLWNDWHLRYSQSGHIVKNTEKMVKEADC